MYQKELTQKVHVNRKAFSVRLMAHFILLCSLAINHSFIATFVPLQMFSIAQSVIDHTSFVSRWVRFLLLLLFLIIFFPFRMQSIVVLSSFRWIRVVSSHPLRSAVRCLQGSVVSSRFIHAINSQSVSVCSSVRWSECHRECSRPLAVSAILS